MTATLFREAADPRISKLIDEFTVASIGHWTTRTKVRKRDLLDVILYLRGLEAQVASLRLAADQADTAGGSVKGP